MIIIGSAAIAWLLSVIVLLRFTDMGYRDPQASKREYLERISEESRRKDEI